MGEAKRRKANDPSYGKPKRGLVISCPIELRENGGVFIKTTALDPQHLRASLLFWDQLAWPTNSAMFIGGDADANFLVESKVLVRPHHQNVSGSGADIFARVQEATLEALDAETPGSWALAQGENSLLIQHNKLKTDQGFAVELLSAIPVPDKDVPLSDILEFRLKRYDELSALREEIDSLARTIAVSDDPRRELEIRLAEIDKRSADALRVCAEWQFPVRLSNVKTSFDIKPFAAIRDSLAALVGSYALGLSSAAVTVATGAHMLSSVKVTGDFGWNGLKLRTTPYRYVAQFHNQLF